MTYGVVAMRRKEQGDGASARLKIRHAVRRRSLEDEGRHM
jgi:plasmid stability protein